MFTFKTERINALAFPVILIVLLQMSNVYPALSQSCTDTSGTFNIIHGMPNLGGGITGAWPVQDCPSTQAPYISFTFSGIVPDNIYSKYCNGHNVPDSLDIWISRTGTGDPDPCSSCPPPINLWRWNGSQWINNSTYINASGNSTHTLTMTLTSMQSDCKTSTCLWIFTGKRETSSTCAQLSNDCFNRGSVSWSRTCQ